MGRLILNSYPERMCIAQGDKTCTLINSPARWRKWPSKSAKAGHSGCTGEHSGFHTVRLVLEFREETKSKYLEGCKTLSLVSYCLPSSLQTAPGV